MKLNKTLLHFLPLMFLSACGGSGGSANDTVIRDYSDTFSALPTESVYPANNPYSESKEKLGEMLFWDPILSGEQNVACASCHHPDFGWADGRNFSIGSDGIGLGPNRYGFEVTPIHSPTVMNTAFTGIDEDGVNDDFSAGGYFWDLRAATLEQQALGPIKNPVEMRGYNISEQDIFPEIITRLKNVPEYVELFEQAYGEGDVVTMENLAKAIATFQRKIISPQTRFDQFMSGDQSVFTEQEIAGLNKFIDGGCSRCHSGHMLSDNLIHEGEAIIEGVVVRTPSLRNLSFTAPYMHDGSETTIEDAIDVYDDRGDIDVSIGGGDVNEIAAFLRTLNTTDFYKKIPSSVPSGLTVGGDIN